MRVHTFIFSHVGIRPSGCKASETFTSDRFLSRREVSATLACDLVMDLVACGKERDL